MTSIYLIGSLRNPEIPLIAQRLRAEGFDVFDDWYSAGPNADDHWRDYEKARGNTYKQAIQGYAAEHVFQFDLTHLNRCDIGVLVYPAGRSAHTELGYMAGKGKPTLILMDEQERWDVMLKVADLIAFNESELIAGLHNIQLLNNAKKNNWWPDLRFGPINLHQMPDVLWFYNPQYYNKMIFANLGAKDAQTKLHEEMDKAKPVR